MATITRRSIEWIYILSILVIFGGVTLAFLVDLAEYAIHGEAHAYMVINKSECLKFNLYTGVKC